MCGIFGIVTSGQSAFDRSQTTSLIENLFALSETRGKDAAGLALSAGDTVTVFKRPLRARRMIHSPEFKQTLRDFQSAVLASPAGAMAVFGHARMVTNGSEETHENNQPVIKHGMVMLHNGIVVNDNALWQTMNGRKRLYQVDTEIIIELVAEALSHGKTMVDAVRDAFGRIEGANSIALLSSSHDGLMLASSNGSLYFARSDSRNELVFASEAYFLDEALKHPSLKNLYARAGARHVQAGEGYAFSFDDLTACDFKLTGQSTVGYALPKRPQAQNIVDLLPAQPYDGAGAASTAFTSAEHHEQDAFVHRINDAVDGLRRCTRCVLPETFPHISFDDDGVCNYCRSYQPVRLEGVEHLHNLVDPHRRSDSLPDCLFPLSGGRDSSYGLHFITRELGLKPVAYTYDWGMVTDLARRNISRMCGKLGIEHILISADIRQKRENIRKNVLAWLKKPDLGTVPLFMAGDKQFFYYANMLMRQMNIDLTIFSQNEFERTEFKTGFTGVQEGGQGEHYWGLTLLNQLKMVGYYGRAFLSNPAYLNASLLDTIFGYASYYLFPRDFILLYHYIPWDEDTLVNTLIGEYDWETAGDTDTVWRIGDGTAPFYNYIYYVMAGFTENDTFRSNQIRAGMLKREEGLRLVMRDNQPRYESIRWYTDTIGIDYKPALRKINQTPRLFPLD